jgi:hypothetical protein
MQNFFGFKFAHFGQKRTRKLDFNLDDFSTICAKIYTLDFSETAINSSESRTFRRPMSAMKEYTPWTEKDDFFVLVKCERRTLSLVQEYHMRMGYYDPSRGQEFLDTLYENPERVGFDDLTKDFPGYDLACLWKVRASYDPHKLFAWLYINDTQDEVTLVKLSGNTHETIVLDIYV